MDADDVNTINAEEKAYRQWVWKERRRILKMTNPVRKQEAWNKLFPPFTMDDSYLEGDVF